MPTSRNIPSEEELYDAGVSLVRRTLTRVLNKVADKPEDAFDKLWYPKLSKFVLKVDLFAEREGRDYLRDRFGDSIEIRGEESSLEHVPRERVAALLDMLDGSDLLERGLGNWCSAVVFFDPARRRVIASMVGVPSRRIYYARESQKGACSVLPKMSAHRRRINAPLHVTEGPKSLREATVAFYGQKVRNFLSVWPGASRFSEWLNDLAGDARERQLTPEVPLFRIYNFGGNPMMLKLAEGHIDAVFDVEGQLCHDVVPGAYIALKAGAVLKDLDNRDITEDYLAEKLENPSAKLRYVLARNRPLAEELVGLLATSVSRPDSRSDQTAGRRA